MSHDIIYFISKGDPLKFKYIYFCLIQLNKRDAQLYRKPKEHHKLVLLNLKLL